MAGASYGNELRTSGPPDRGWRDYYVPARRTDSDVTVFGLPLAGLAAVGLGVLAWYYLGPDLRRYLKIRSM